MEEQESEIDKLLDKIPDSKFIAIDCEFSGINPKSKSVKTLEDYLVALKEDVDEYALLQIGFCLATKSEEEDRWVLHPYNLYTYSSEMYNTIFYNGTLKWLRENGFSLDRWVDEGVDFKRLGTSENESGSFINKRTRRNELHHVIRAIVEYKIPLVFHNGMLDILHIYDKFVDSLPKKPLEISKEITRVFGGGVFDTKVIGKYLFENLEQTFLKNTTLPVLYSNLNSMEEVNKLATVSEERKHLNYVEEETGKIKENLYHEAGFDALITALVFTFELNILAKKDDLSAEDLLDFRNEKKDRGNHIDKLVNCCNIHDPIDQAIYNFKEHSESEE